MNTKFAVAVGWCLLMAPVAVHAEGLWHCGYAKFIEVTIHDQLSSAPATLKGPGMMRLTQDAAPIDLTCGRTGSDSGYLWACHSERADLASLRVGIFRGNHTGDPWASAWVSFGGWRLEQPLECTVR